MKYYDYLLIILSGVLLAVARLPYYCGWLVFLAWLPLLQVISRRKQKRRHLLLASFGFNAVNVMLWLAWIGEVTPGGLVGMIFLFTAYYYVVFWLLNRVWIQFPKLRYVALVSVLLSFEILQNYGQLQFAWFDLCYALADYTVLLQLAELGGTTLISLLVILVNITLWELLHRRYRLLLPMLGLIVVWTGFGVWRMRSLPVETRPFRIAVMQPSIPQDEKWEADNFNAIYSRYMQLVTQAERDSVKLVVMPEAAMPAYLMLDSRFAQLISRLCIIHKVDIFIGFPDVKPAPEGYPGEAYYYNAATLFHADGLHDKPYYKNILVPIGERIPWMQTFPVLWKLQFGQANWEYGKKIVRYNSGGYSFAPSICYELAFADHFRRMSWEDGYKGTTSKADFLINVTNDAWFGTTHGPWVHAMMTKFRAIENRIAIYRSANTGITMVIDPLGRIRQRTKLFEIRNLTDDLLLCRVRTLYTRIHIYRLIFPVLAVGLLIMCLIPIRLHRKGEAL